MKSLLVTALLIAVFTAECFIFSNEDDGALITDSSQSLPVGTEDPDQVRSLADELETNGDDADIEEIGTESLKISNADDSFLTPNSSQILIGETGDFDQVNNFSEELEEDNDTSNKKERNYHNAAKRRGKKNNVLKQILMDLTSIKQNVVGQGCQKGTFWFAPSDQCFLYLANGTNWATANSYCKARGLVLAKPYNPVALRAYIVSRYTYGGSVWLGAQGTGKYTGWTRDGAVLSTNSGLWYSGQNGAKSSSYCLALMTHGYYLKSYYNTPYYMYSCSIKNPILCEYVKK